MDAKEIKILRDSTSAIAITQNPVLHSRKKNINIKHHFTKDHVEKKDIKLEYKNTELQLTDILTKPLCESRSYSLRHGLGIIEMSNFHPKSQGDKKSKKTKSRKTF